MKDGLLTLGGARCTEGQRRNGWEKRFQFGQEPEQQGKGGVQRRIREERGSVRGREIAAEGVQERSERQGLILREGLAIEHPRPLRLADLYEGAAQLRLAHAGLACLQHQLWAAAGRPLSCLTQLLQFVCAPDKFTTQ